MRDLENERCWKCEGRLYLVADGRVLCFNCGRYNGLASDPVTDLQALCEWLEEKGTRHAAYRDTVEFYKPDLAYLLYPRWKKFRDGALFWGTGWGWRLRKEWRQRVQELQTEQLAQ